MVATFNKTKLQWALITSFRTEFPVSFTLRFWSEINLLLFWVCRGSAHTWHLPGRSHGHAEGVHKESWARAAVRRAQLGVPGERESVKPPRPPQRLALAWSLWKPPNRREYEHLDQFWHLIRLHENFHECHKFAEFERSLGLRLKTCLYTPPENSLSFRKRIGQMGKSI